MSVTAALHSPLLKPPHTKFAPLDAAGGELPSGYAFGDFANTVPTLLFACSADGRRAYFNHHWLEYTGLANPQLLEAQWQALVHPDDHLALAGDWQAAQDQPELFEAQFRLRNAQGEFRWHLLRARPVRNRDGDCSMWTGVVTEIEQPRQEDALQALRESEHRFSQFANSSDDVFWIADPTCGHLIYVSPAFEQLWGLKVEALKADPGLWNRSLLAAASIALPEPFFMPSAAAGGKEPVREYRIQRPDGSPLWIRDRRFHLHTAQGEVSCIGGIAEDITERKVWDMGCEVVLALEREARREAEAQASAKDEFLAVVSHELRSPLNAIRGWAHVLRQTGELSHSQLRMLDAIDRNTLAQAQLVDDMLDTQRLLRGKVKLELRDTSLVALVEQAVDTFRPAAAAKRIVMSVQHDAELDVIEADPERLRQALVNLLSNAMKFTPEQGHVEVVSRSRNGRVAISVVDSGIGIDPALLPRIFDPFRQAADASTRRQSGLGLGLALARQLVELHGGSLRAASLGLDRGATFTIELPRRHASAKPAAVSGAKRTDSHTAGIKLTGCRVAVVDDDVEARQILELLLSRHQARPVVFSSVAASYDYFKSVPPEQRPQVLISDIAMPDEDGYSLVRRLRLLEQQRGERPMLCVALTAFVTEKDRARALSAGFDAHLGKPVDPRQLLVTVKGLLETQAKEAST